MDFDTALHLYEHMIPKPLEIICYHCQQFAEKILKASLILYEHDIPKTHDLGMLMETLKEHISVPKDVMEACDNLTTYGVIVRYPLEIHIEAHHAEEAIRDARRIRQWIESTGKF